MSRREDAGATDWRGHAVRLLALQQRQLRALSDDGEARLGELATAFGVMTDHLSRGDQVPVDGALRESMIVATKALQFADSQAQRLDHLAAAIGRIAGLMQGMPDGDLGAWESLRAELRECYTMPREREVFDQFFGGGDRGEATGKADDGPAIELF